MGHWNQVLGILEATTTEATEKRFQWRASANNSHWATNRIRHMFQVSANTVQNVRKHWAISESSQCFSCHGSTSLTAQNSIATNLLQRPISKTRTSRLSKRYTKTCSFAALAPKLGKRGSQHSRSYRMILRDCLWGRHGWFVDVKKIRGSWYWFC